jgi:hypothetical protein
MYAMGGLLSVALVCNALMRPVHPKHYIVEDDKVDERKSQAKIDIE